MRMDETRQTPEEQPAEQSLEANHPFVQWLRTYLLWAYLTSIEPRVIASSSNSERAVSDNLRWDGQTLWVERSLLERIPPRLLAILAVHRYLEEIVWRRYLPIPWLLAGGTVILTFAVASYLQQRFGMNLLWHLLHLLVIPLLLDLPSLLREHTRQLADEEALRRLAEPDMLLHALEVAIIESYRNGESEKVLQRSLKRLNRLRAKRGEPMLTLNRLKAHAEPASAPPEGTELAENETA